MKMKRKTILIIILFNIFLISCSLHQDKNYYIHDEPKFSFEYPKDFQPQTLQNPAEVVRFAANNALKLPELVAYVADKEADFKQTSVAQEIFKKLQLLAPGISGFKVVDKKTIKLKDDSEAYYYKMVWYFGGGISSMETISVTVIKENKKITLTGTVLSNQNLTDEVIRLCLTLNARKNKK